LTSRRRRPSEGFVASPAFGSAWSANQHPNDGVFVSGLEREADFGQVADLPARGWMSPTALLKVRHRRQAKAFVKRRFNAQQEGGFEWKALVESVQR
jgi:hypothetical protein